MSFVCHSYNICFYSYVTRIPFVCHSYVFTYVIRMYPNVIHISLVCTPVSSVCYSYLLVCHVAPLVYTRLSWYGTHMCSYVVYATRMYSNVIGMSLVCTGVSSVCHSYVVIYHPHVTRMYWCVICMSSVYTRMSSVCHWYVVLPGTIIYHLHLN